MNTRIYDIGQLAGATVISSGGELRLADGTRAVFRGHINPEQWVPGEGLVREYMECEEPWRSVRLPIEYE
jgi:hypothetical protein